MEGERLHPSHGGDDTGSGPSTPPIRVRPRHDWFLMVCRGFGVITALAAILCIAVNVLSAVRSFRNGLDIFDGIFRCYAVLIAMFVVVAETEWDFIMKFSKILEYWAGRGMLQIFVAVMTRAYPESFEKHRELFLLQSIASYLLLACGVVYIISGMLCIGVFKRARQKKEVTRDQAIKDLQDLERRREELESLLIVDNA
ncbi:Golgi apparatus membrane protein TVP15 [Forsythia ovata]|uniref:Golgi apparatus membrane protein TVP15 n=1 Tax=Forsythia ovata TaxID=205694 RepID=A0ABD1TLI4_9LAMI